MCDTQGWIYTFERGTTRFIIVDVGLYIYSSCYSVCEAHRYVNMPTLGRFGGMPAGKFEKLLSLRLNLRAFFSDLSPFNALVDMHVHKTS